MKGKTTEAKPPDTIAMINEEVGRLKGLEEMRVQKATTLVEVAKAALQPTVLEAQRSLRMLETYETKYRAMLQGIQERKLTETFGNRWAQVVDGRTNELSVMLNVLSRQLHQAIEMVEELTCEGIEANVHHRIRSMVKGADGAESRIAALVGQIKQGLGYLSKLEHPQNGTKIKMDQPGKLGLPRLHHEKPDLKVIT